MMSSAEQPEISEQLLARYLLGALSEEETERLDELSIADDAFALRLETAENDLVDAFLEGGLSGDSLKRFESFYLSSERKVEKVEFAKALRRLAESAAAGAAERSTVKSGMQVRQNASDGRSVWRWFTLPRAGAPWVLASGALAMTLVAGYLLVANQRLHQQILQARSSQSAVNQREQEVERQLQEQRAAQAEISRKLDGIQQSQTNLDDIKTFAAVLLPPTRGAGTIPTVSVNPDTALVVLLLRLESDEFAVYRVGLRDAINNQVVWRSKDLKAEASGSDKTVSINFSARLLKQQIYVLELSGLSGDGRVEPISGYPIRVVIE
jgi:hypothetical protein